MTPISAAASYRPNLTKITTGNVTKHSRSISLIFASAFILHSPALAGGFDLSRQLMNPLFEDGNYLGISGGGISPVVTGADRIGKVNNVARFTSAADLALKFELSDSVDLSFIADQPWGQFARYSSGLAAGTYGNISSFALTGALRYKLGAGFSVYGGLRAQTLWADAASAFTIPTVGVAKYSISAPQSIGLGYVVGGAFELPEIGLRTSITYNSAVNHSSTAQEHLDLSQINAALTPSSPKTDLSIKTPDSLNFYVQSGLSRSVLLFGGVRWVDWPDVRLSTPSYAQLRATLATINPQLQQIPMISYQYSTYTYQLGGAFRLTDNFSLIVSGIYEPTTKEPQTQFAPVNGAYGVNLGISYKMDSGLRISAITSAAKLGDTSGEVGTFKNNYGYAAAINFGYNF